MVSHSSQLLPFAEASRRKAFSVTGTISRSGNILYLLYRLPIRGDQVMLPEQIALPLRRNNLWQTTCFECFLKPEGGNGYYELNISPDGCWNMYRFTDYRKEMVEEPALTSIASETYVEDGFFTLRCSFSCDGFIFSQASLSAGLSCVLEHRDGEKSFWALTHPGPQPDFHHPDSFLLTL